MNIQDFEQYMFLSGEMPVFLSNAHMPVIKIKLQFIYILKWSPLKDTMLYII